MYRQRDILAAHAFGQKPDDFRFGKYPRPKEIIRKTILRAPLRSGRAFISFKLMLSPTTVVSV